MNHSLQRRRQALHQNHHHYYLNISVEAANLSDWRMESNRNFFCPNWNALPLSCASCNVYIVSIATDDVTHSVVYIRVYIRKTTP